MLELRFPQFMLVNKGYYANHKDTIFISDYRVAVAEVINDVPSDGVWTTTSSLQVRPKVLKRTSRGVYYESGGVRIYLSDDEVVTLEEFISTQLKMW